MSNQTPRKDDLTELVEFIRYSLKEGLSIEQITESLRESGKSDDQITVAIHSSLQPGPFADVTRVRLEVPGDAPEEGRKLQELPEPQGQQVEPSSPQLEMLSTLTPVVPAIPIQQSGWKPGDAAMREPKIELMDFPQVAPSSASKPANTRLNTGKRRMSDQELIAAYKQALKKKADKKRKEKSWERVRFSIMGGIASFLFFYLLSKKGNLGVILNDLRSWQRFLH